MQNAAICKSDASNSKTTLQMFATWVLVHTFLGFKCNKEVVGISTMRVQEIWAWWVCVTKTLRKGSERFLEQQLLAGKSQEGQRYFLGGIESLLYTFFFCHFTVSRNFFSSFCSMKEWVFTCEKKIRTLKLLRSKLATIRCCFSS